MRRKVSMSGFVIVLALVSIPGFSTGAGPADTPAMSAGKYNGPGSCAASSCHGSVQPRNVTPILQNEYSIWIAQDKHAKAHAVLSNPVSVRMGKILDTKCADGKPCPPSQAPKCLACHALSVAPEQRAQTFEADDGVSCESCHGPASGWLGPHTVKDWPHEKSVALGMYDTRNLIKRSEKCMSCHVGTAEKFVDHEMIAAGHPDLTFDLSYFSFYMPTHWKLPEQNNAWRSVQAWGTGQAVQLRESLDRLARRAEGPTWPEYAELECFACHHSLTAAGDSWRQERGYSGRRPGNPPWNEARVVVFRDLVGELHPNTAKRLSDDLMKLAGLMNQLNGNRAEIASTAKSAASLANDLAVQLENQPYDAAVTLRVMRRIASDSKMIAAQGERPAEQAAMALDVLYRAYQQNNNQGLPGVRAPLDGLIELVKQNPSYYSAPRFAAQMQKVNEALGGQQVTVQGAQ
jgi:hypothetical protein